MGSPDLLRYLNGIGLSLRVDGDHIVVSPVAKLTDDVRILIRSRRQELVDQVIAVSLTTAALIDSINAACDARGDDNANRFALIEEGAAMSPEEQTDLTEHFAEVARIYQLASRGLSYQRPSA